MKLCKPASLMVVVSATWLAACGDESSSADASQALGTGTGLQATYYDNQNFTRPILTRVDPRVDFSWGTSAPARGVGADTFSVRWTGSVEALYSETYRFYTTSDDGVRLWVDGRLLIDNWTEHAPTENSGSITLEAGRRYDIKLEYFEGWSAATIRLAWSSPSQSKSVIPTTQLYSAAAAPAANSSCATADEGNSASLGCPAGQTISGVKFASYGTPTGSCGAFAKSSCDASSTVSKVQDLCLGRNSCTVPATNVTFGDPCVNTYKRLYVEATCAVPSTGAGGTGGTGGAAGTGGTRTGGAGGVASGGTGGTSTGGGASAGAGGTAGGVSTGGASTGGASGSAGSTGAPSTASLMVNIGQDCYWCNFPLFVDLVKAAESWRYDWSESYDGSLLQRDANGWVRQISGSGVARAIIGRPQRLGNYHVYWTGKGRFRIHSEDVPSVNVDVTSTGAGSRAFQIPAAGNIILDIVQTDSSDHLRDIAVVHDDFASTHETQPFYPEMLTYLGAFRGVRLMDFLLTNNSSQASSADRVPAGYYTQGARGASYEYAAKLCNALKRDCWINIPHRATDDYVRTVATVLRDQLDPSLKLYVEYSNETWNFMFDQANYCRDMGVQQNLTPGDAYEMGFRFHGKRSVEVFKIFEQVFGGATSSRLVRVIAGQASNAWLAGVHLDYSDNRQHTDAYAVAPYFAGDSNGGFGGQARSWSLDQLFSHLGDTDLPATRRSMQAMKDVLSSRGVRMIAYEGGQHLVDWSGDSTLTNLYIAANRDPRMGTLYKQYLDAWKAVGGETFALYSAMGAYSQYGSWGLKETLNQPTSQAHKYRAVTEWMAANPKWWN